MPILHAAAASAVLTGLGCGSLWDSFLVDRCVEGTACSGGLPSIRPVQFSIAPSLPVGKTPVSIAVGDFNHDNKTDLVVASTSSNTISILLGTGLGEFGVASNLLINTGPAAGPVAVVVGDFDGDITTDFAVTTRSKNIYAIFGQGNGQYIGSTKIEIADINEQIAAFDVTGDKRTDIISTRPGNDNVSILISNAGQGFSENVYSYGNIVPQAIMPGEFTGDTLLDLAVLSVENSCIHILKNTGSGSLSSQSNLAVDPDSSSIAVGNFNGDGAMDLAIMNTARNQLIIHSGSGDGLFSAADKYSIGANSQAIASKDLNADGFDDFIIAENSGYISILLSNGSGRLSNPVRYRVGSSPQSIAIGDFNGDSKPDIAVANASSDNVSILLNQSP